MKVLDTRAMSGIQGGSMFSDLGAAMAWGCKQVVAAAIGFYDCQPSSYEVYGDNLYRMTLN